MKLLVVGERTRVSEGLHDFITRRLHFVLGRFAPEIERVTARIGDLNGPGHGQEDFEVGLRYGLDVLAPVDDTGKFTEDAPPFQGQFVFKADPNVTALLREKGALLKEDRLAHSYPHCWRSKNPVIFRATPQWFIGVDTPFTPDATPDAPARTLRQGAQAAIIGRNATGNWYQVRPTGGSTGWVTGSPALVQVTGDLTAVPVVSAPVPAAKPAGRSVGTIVLQTASGGPIYVANADGSNLRYLTTGMDPAISPDGQWVAFTRWDGVQSGITGSLWVINVDGSRERQVMSGAHQPKSPTWSADGQKIIISMQNGGTVDDTWMCMIDRKPVESPEPIEGQHKRPARGGIEPVEKAGV